MLVVSCDKYADLWKPFFTLFWRHWSDCPFRVLLTSNFLTYPDPRVRTIRSLRHSNWTDELQYCLTQIEEPEVLVILEDFLIRRDVLTGAMMEAIRAWREMDGKMLRFHRPWPHTRIKSVPMFGACEPGTTFRVTLQAAIWKKDTLESLLQPGENAWEFELNGTERSEASASGYYCTYESLIPYKRHVIEKGAWYWDEARYFRRLDIGCDFERRNIMPFWTCLRLRWQTACARFMEILPWRQRRRLRRLLRKYPGVRRIGLAIAQFRLKGD